MKSDDLLRTDALLARRGGWSGPQPEIDMRVLRRVVLSRKAMRSAIIVLEERLVPAHGYAIVRAPRWQKNATIARRIYRQSLVTS
jgi:hypothetical protein